MQACMYKFFRTFICLRKANETFSHYLSVGQTIFWLVEISFDVSQIKFQIPRR